MVLALRHTALLFLMLVLSFPLRAAGDGDDLEEKRLSLEELEGLAAKGEWSQVLFHSDEIASADRGARWQSLVEKAAIGNLVFLRTSGVTGADQISLELQRHFPFLTRSKAFTDERNGSGLAAYDTCLRLEKKSSDCTSRLFDFTEQDKGDSDFQFRAGKWVARKQDAVAALRFFERVLGRVPNSLKSKFCGDADLHVAVIAGLRLNPGEAAKRAASLADKECWSALEAEIEGAFDREPAGNFSQNVCPLLKSRNQVNGKRVAKCAPSTQAQKPGPL